MSDHASPAVDQVEVVRARLPLRAPVSMAGERITEARNVFVRVRAGGQAGWGEATSAAATTGETPEAIASTLDAFVAQRVLVGMPVAAARVAAAAALSATPAAASAVDIALGDLEARLAGQSLAAMLGWGGGDAAFPVSVIISGPDREAEIEAARRAVASGVRILKLKVGRGDPGAEGVTACRVRDAVGPAVVLGADANAGMGRDAAAAFCAAAAAAGLAFLEQPLPREDLEGMAALRRGTSIPIAADEGIGGPEDVVRHHEAGAADGVMLKFQKAGGIERVIAAALEARSRGLRIGLTGKVAESGVAGSALVHVAAALGGVDYGISLTAAYLAHDPVRLPIVPVDGAVRLPQGSGLGVEPNEALLAAQPW